MALTIQLQVENDRLTARADEFAAPIDTLLADLPPLMRLQADPFEHSPTRYAAHFSAVQSEYKPE